MGRNLLVRLLHRLRPGAVIVSQLVWSEVSGREPRARLETDHLEPRLREGERRHAADCAEADDDDIGLLQINGHGSSLPPISSLLRSLLSRTCRSHIPTSGSASA